MASGFDYFGAGAPPSFGTPAARGSVMPGLLGVPTTGAQAVPGAPPATFHHVGWQTGRPVAAATVSRRRIWTAFAAAAALIALAAAAVYVWPAGGVALPRTVAGYTRISTSSSISSGELEQVRSGLRNRGIHDASVAVYEDVNGAGVAVIAGRTSAGAPSFAAAIPAMVGAEPAAGITVTPSTVTLGESTVQCGTISATAGSETFCVWQGTRAVLVGFGTRVDDRGTATVLATARTAAHLS